MTRVDNTSGILPFLKWPGGKRWLLRRGIRVPVLADDATYFEPFVGGGSLFFALKPRSAVLGDINRNLISAYRGLRARPGHVVSTLQGLANNKSTYRRLREWQPTGQVDRAVRLIYLNRTAFSGLYRENQAGKFNVPYGNYRDRHLCQEGVLRTAARQLRSASLSSGHFAEVASQAKSGDFVYFDPPYISGHQNNGFVRYNRNLFNWEHQEELASLARDLVSRGVHVLISNTAHEDLLALYKGFDISRVVRNSQVSPDPRFRGPTIEALVASYSGVLDA